METQTPLSTKTPQSKVIVAHQLDRYPWNFHKIFTHELPLINGNNKS